MTIASEQQSADYFRRNDPRWAETLQGEDSPTGQPIIFINDQKFRDAGATNYRDKMVFGESLHLLKQADPKRYNRLRSAALSDPEFMDWATHSYYLETRGNERRPFYQWLDVSRLDQVIGGFLMGGDPDIPTMRNWGRDLPFGTRFRKELEQFERELSDEWVE